MATSSDIDRQLDLLVGAVQQLAVARRRGDDAVSRILPGLGELLRDTLEVIGRSGGFLRASGAGHGGPASERGGGDPAIQEIEPRSGRLLSLVRNLRASPGPTDRFVVRSGGRLLFLRADDVDWIEAAGNYVRLHAGATSHLLRETMTAVEARLDPMKFVRIHRSRIVNVERVERLQPWLNGEYAVILRTGTRLTLSRGCRERIQDRLRGQTLSHPQNL